MESPINPAQHQSTCHNVSQTAAKNTKNLSIKEFFTSKLMRARSFEGNANSPRDETSNWFDEFKARMTKKSQYGSSKQATTNNSAGAEENSVDASEVNIGSHFRLGGDQSPKEKSDTESLRKSKLRGNVSEPADLMSSKNDPSLQDDTSSFDLDPRFELRDRRHRAISCIERPDFDTASINTIFDRRDSRCHSVSRPKKARASLLQSRALLPLKWLIAKILPLDYNLPWKMLTLISLAFAIIMTSLIQNSKPGFQTFSFLNGFLCGLIVAFACIIILVLIVVVALLPKTQDFPPNSSITAAQSPYVRLNERAKSATRMSHTNANMSSQSEPPEQKSDDFSMFEILDGCGNTKNVTDGTTAHDKRIESLDEEDYRGWMIEFIGDYELRNKSEVKLKLIYVRIENRVLYLCKPKNSHDAETSVYPTFISQRVYDLNLVKKFSANLLLPKSVRNRQKWVWSKKYPIRIEFVCESDLTDTKTLTESPREIGLTLFAKSCREKEEWFRRFKNIVEDIRLLQCHSMKRSSLDSNISSYNDEISPSISQAPSIRSPSPAGIVQTSKSSHYLNGSSRESEETSKSDQEDISITGLKRTKSCDALNADQVTPNESSRKKSATEKPDALDVKSVHHDDSTLTKETAELLSQVLDDTHFLESRPNLCYRDYIERIIDSGKEATNTSDWFNALTGRIFFDVFSHNYWSVWFKRKIQRKLYRIRLPYFMETLTLTKIDLGTNAPHFLNVASHSYDSFGLSIDFDMTYNGGLTMTFETKLNLLKIKSDNSGTSNNSSSSSSQGATSGANQSASTMNSSTCNNQAHTSQVSSESSSKFETISENNSTNPSSTSNKTSQSSSGSARTSGESSNTDDESESESSSDSSLDDDANNDEISDWEDYGAEKTRQNIVKFVDKIASSRYFQQATENRYIKKKLQNISNCPLVLVVQIQSLNGVLTLNVPPPQTDRVWYGFKPNPELVLKALPKMGDREVNMSHVTDWIERKLAEEFRKILVIPNMEDIVLPVLKSDHLLYVATTK